MEEDRKWKMRGKEPILHWSVSGLHIEEDGAPDPREAPAVRSSLGQVRHSLEQDLARIEEEHLGAQGTPQEEQKADEGDDEFWVAMVREVDLVFSLTARHNGCVTKEDLVRALQGDLPIAGLQALSLM